MDDKEYETVTAALYQAMGESSGITIECFGSSCRVQGKSGSWYQIDVLTRQSNGLQTVRTAIECKYWQKRVTRNVVSNLITTVEDTNIEKGVIVSKEGFTSGAIALAKQRNISLVEMREPNDADWEGTIKTIHIMMHMTWPEFYDFEFVQPPQQAGNSIQFTASGQDLTIKEPGKETNGYFPGSSRRGPAAPPAGPDSCPPALSPRPWRNRRASSCCTPGWNGQKYTVLPGRNKPGFPATP